jgi:hypothetical protein
MVDGRGTTSSLDLRYLDPEDVRVWVGEDRRVYATIADDLTVITPSFVRSHPLSDPDRYISIRGSDPKENSPAKGIEFGLLRNWRRVDSVSRELIELELGRRYLHPRVTAILSTRDYSGLRVCVFQTDRGEREVTLRDVRDNVIYLGGNRVLITDAEGNRYDVDDIESLDPESRARLVRIL